nr:hypothetical protein Itr_chr03CG24510 [Ipomoea trifida]
MQTSHVNASMSYVGTGPTTLKTATRKKSMSFSPIVSSPLDVSDEAKPSPFLSIPQFHALSYTLHVLVCIGDSKSVCSICNIDNAPTGNK